MFFTFNTGIELNKEAIENLKEEFNDYLLEEDIECLLTTFEEKELNKKFFEKFIKHLKSLNCVSMDKDECKSKDGAVIIFIEDILGQELKEPQGVLGIRYLYDEWEYEGCGYNDHYHATYVDKQKVIKKYTKEAQEAVKKLRAVGVDVTFSID